MLCNLKILSGKVYHPGPPHAQSLFLFPIVFGINLIHFFDGKNNINTRNYWKLIEKEIVHEVARGDKPYLRKSTDIAKHKSVR